MRAFAATAALVALGTAAQAAMPERCTVPYGMIEPHALLPRVTLALKNAQKLDIVVLSGAPSQVKPVDGPRSYPSFLESELKTRLPNAQIRVVVRTAPRRSAIEVLPTLPEIIAAEKPTLVIWQSGTVEAYRGIDADAYGRKLQLGIGVLLDAGVDVMLVNMQYSPRTDAMVDAAAYTEVMRRVADVRDVPFFNRYRIMREWNDAGTFDLSALHIGRAEYEEIHGCLGALMAEFLVRAASLNHNVSR